MWHYHRAVLTSLASRYDAVIVSASLYSLVLCILTTNSLLALTFVQVYYRIYFF